MSRLTGAKFINLPILGLLLCCLASAATADRITRSIDPRQTVRLHAPVHRLAQPQFDRGPVAADFAINHMLLLVKPSAAQQTELDQLLAAQQNPSSAMFHKWLTPEDFGSRFGLNLRDHAKVVAWLRSEGFTVDESGRAHNWIDFSGAAAQVNRALHTSIHRYQVNGEDRFANASEISVPAGLAGVTAGLRGLNNFRLKSPLHTISPAFNSGTSHYLVPEDFSTIYDLTPLSAAGIDGAGVSLGVVGLSQLQLSDLAAFRTKYKLPPNVPKAVVAGSNPGLDPNALMEANLDLEWSGAVAPGASFYYYYSTDPLIAITSAINANVVQLLSISYGGSEIDNSAIDLQPVFQQANAQGITVFAATGDLGAANVPDFGAFSTLGPVVSWPASYPEVTAVGGTQLNEGTGSYWAATNDASQGSALSYIPEIAWLFGGGGASTIFSKPVWQAAPGVPADNARDIPDVSLAASNSHDGYEVVYLGSTFPVGGTSASTPTFAGITALLNHYLVANGQLAKPGLGNINPQLYRMAQSTPTAFHDITSGNNATPCQQGTPGCLSGTFGYSAGPGYDLAAGIGSVDGNVLVTNWNSTTSAVNVSFILSPAKGTYNDTFQLTATVTSASGSGTPTGYVDFSYGTASIPLGSVALDPSSGQPVATLTIAGYQIGSGVLIAQYRGDTAFSSGGATAKITVNAPTGVSSIVPSLPISVTANTDPTGLFWSFTIILNDATSVPAILTGVNVDGQDQPVSQYFPSVSIPPLRSITSNPIIYRNLAYPLVRTFVFTGIDSTGQTWTRQASVTFLGPNSINESVILTAVPLVMPQNPAADPSCQWSQQLVLTENTGIAQNLTGMLLGNIDVSSQIPAIFGSTQLAAYGTLQGNLCWSGVVPGATDTVDLFFASGLSQDIAVSFAGPIANPVPVSISPATLSLATADPASPAQATFSIAAPDGQPWSISVSPQNLTNAWLTLSQTSGTGAAQVTVQASGNGFAPGAYLANLVLQGPGMLPAAINLPVMFVYGDSSATTITGLTNAASGASVAAPGMQAILTGTGLVAKSITNTGYAYTPSGLLVSVNGIPAAFKSATATRIVFQIPYEAGVGPAVVGVSYNGEAAGYLFNVSTAAPGIFADANGNLTPVATVQAGKSLTLTMTGDGATNLAITDGTPAPRPSLSLQPALPFNLTIGGAPAFLVSYGQATGAYSVTTVNAIVPANTPAGVQPVVVTVNGVASPPVNVTITAAP